MTRLAALADVHGKGQALTRLAVIADVHGDLEALRLAIGQIGKLACDGIICCGDLVGYGHQPEKVIEVVDGLGIPCVRGNWDRWAVGDETPPDVAVMMLSLEARSFLRGLPRVWKRTIDGVRVVVVHGSTKDEMDGIFPDVVTGQQLRQRLDDAAADVLIVGHSHEPFRLEVQRGVVANPGALYRQPLGEASTIKVFDVRKDEFVEVARSSGGMFGILELPSKRFEVRRAVDGQVAKIVRVAKG